MYLADFMNDEQERYVEDIKQRRNAPRGKLSVVEDVIQEVIIIILRPIRIQKIILMQWLSLQKAYTR